MDSDDSHKETIIHFFRILPTVTFQESDLPFTSNLIDGPKSLAKQAPSKKWSSDSWFWLEQCLPMLSLKRHMGTTHWRNVRRDTIWNEFKWAGGVIQRDADADYYLTTVSGQFVVPTVSVPAGGTAVVYTLSIWAGISGTNVNAALAQSFLYVSITQDGTITCSG